MYIPNIRRVEVLSAIGKNKAISLRNLYDTINERTSYQNFSLLIKRMEKEGVIKSYVGYGKVKYLILTKDGAAYTPYCAPHGEDTKILSHDVIAANVLRNLLTFKSFESGHIPVGNWGLDVIPDGIIYANKGDKKYTLAVEVELTQKSKKRVWEKFVEYHKTKDFNHVLYIIGCKTIFNSYKKILLRMSQDIQKRIVLALMPNNSLSKGKCEYNNSIYFFLGQDKKFSELFGK